MYHPDEFLEDVGRLASVQRTLTKWKKGKPINSRLMINNMVILYNMFGVELTKVAERAAVLSDTVLEMDTLLVFLRRVDTSRLIDIRLYECLEESIQ